MDCRTIGFLALGTVLLLLSPRCAPAQEVRSSRMDRWQQETWGAERPTLQLPSTLSELFASSREEGVADLAARIDSFLVLHPELKSLVLRELLVGNDGSDGIIAGTRDQRFAFQWREIPRMTEFQRNSMILQRTRELMFNPSLNTIRVSQADLRSILQLLFQYLH